MNADEYLPAVYDELRKLAAAKMANERADHTLDATALVHEAYLRAGGERSFESRSHFLRTAAEAMRRILVDHARARNAEKRGGDARQVSLDGNEPVVRSRDEEIEALHEALTRLAVQHPEQAELVQLRQFGGLTLEECAQVLGVAPRTADAWWAYARAWLILELGERR